MCKKINHNPSDGYLFYVDNYICPPFPPKSQKTKTVLMASSAASDGNRSSPVNTLSAEERIIRSLNPPKKSFRWPSKFTNDSPLDVQLPPLRIKPLQRQNVLNPSIQPTHISLNHSHADPTSPIHHMLTNHQQSLPQSFRNFGNPPSLLPYVNRKKCLMNATMMQQISHPFIRKGKKSYSRRAESHKLTGWWEVQSVTIGFSLQF